MTKVVKTISIGNLFKLCNADNTKYYEEQLLPFKIKINSPNGFVNILSLIKKNDITTVKCDIDGATIIGADKHRIKYNNEWRYLDSFDNVEYIGKYDLYDVALNNPHEYITTNGIIHHNTTLAHAICKEMDADYIYLNMSLEGSIDTLRTTIRSFATSKSLTGKPKIVIMDECLEENESVRIGTIDSWNSVALKDLDFGIEYPIVSMNTDTGELFNDTGSLISQKDDEVFEIVLEDNKTIKVTGNHPFMIKDKKGCIVQKSINDGLNFDDEIISINKILQTIKIKSITSIGIKTVRNLHVNTNHTFITENGIVTHNCDGMSRDFQQSYRGFVESYFKTCRFILTANYITNIIEPLREGRFQLFDFNYSSEEYSKEMKPKIVKRLCSILKYENTEYEVEAVETLVNKCFPNIRKMISTLQKFKEVKGVINSNVLNFVQIDEELYKLILNRKFTDARSLIIRNAYDYDTVYRGFYDHLVPMLDKTKQANAIILIAEYMYKSNSAIDKEIQLAACLLELIGCL